MKIGMLYDEQFLPDIDKILEMGAYSANIHYTDFSTTLLSNLNQHDIKLHCYTVNKYNEIIRLINEGVDGLFTDNPDLSDF
jgi:glycerophosphoryl diester phosphodiesterase